MLALVAGTPGLALGGGKAAFGPSSCTDPIPRLFGEFRELIDRHSAALAACDRLEAGLLAEIGYTRVRLPRGGDGAPRYADDAAAITEAVLTGRARDRLCWVLRGRQRRWDAAAAAAGLSAARGHEAALEATVGDAADALLTTPAWTVEAVALKLIVLLAVQEPEPSAYRTAPWRELRQFLCDLYGLSALGEGPAP